ncbi:hypothetical protein H0I76_10295 [Limibaculum sp. M0105]|uniref:Outer membrane protein beta-barrel domain-containing protein n=1 Tax=Thermohalobaculum xanthum TaxID=2753746 RepID=A0A8J7SE22_9RHOB|nr:hypothetical protein [Thermohalobaculum xanthum]MBK0399583.1 hypothetical protein [Thermohalobaculum xanthum]
MWARHDETGSKTAAKNGLRDCGQQSSTGSRADRAVKTLAHLAASFCVGVVATSLSAGQAHAEPELAGSVTVYGWLPWTDATVTTGRGGLSASMTGGDVLEALDFTVMATGNVQYGRFGAILDFVYAKLSNDEATSRGFPGTRAKLSLKETLLTGALTYRILDKEGAYIDAFAGARYVSMSADVTVTGGGPIGAVLKASGDQSWVDPIIGVRGRLPVTDKLSLNALADIGGFGVGSQFSWEIFTGVSYAFTQRFSGQAGFRYISIDYSNDGKEYDVDFYGPAVGLTVKF